ncbi:BLUF domain-containing protein [Novosphingobium sp.]|uniref:BLUF domain-containing protein n=1 Tax=Novosphingobium sp. TaxID=1874826 RepID=UPI0038B7C358
MIYLSAATQPFDDATLAVLERQASARNASLGVTGLLVWNGSGFLQLLEGPVRSVEQLMTSIGRDPRHRDITVVRKVNRIVVNRHKAECPGWGMRAVSAPLRVEGSASRFAATLPSSMAMETRIMFTSFAAALHWPAMA